MKNAAWLGMILLATARATRFVTSDFLGDWTVVLPARRWANRRDRPVEDAPHGIQPLVMSDEEFAQKWIEQETDPDLGWRSKLVKGLDCPFCVGFWIGGAILLGEATLGRSPLRPLWRFGIGMLGLNYLVGHISSRIDG
ncbi:hypothetical protein PBI_TEAMOCIL_18 [Microbacterium phage Teamocil]|uniref:DUF1360 domain-containing protein n=1 Tax=Microbacterium phage Teamocil TaxID=2656554 RepID=A0A649VWG7_9CAUD|nr:hypothetical protein QDA12_gp18 [Microbacterium phage Teamocil]QGJ96970.1 hypothetical protein PBI_TEAMOCIL_18 [Microbacterium phage Teamocil]